MTHLQVLSLTALSRATRSTHWWRPPEVGTSSPLHRWPDSPSRTRIFRAGLPCEPGRRFYQDLPIELELPIFPPQLSQLFLFVCRQPVFPKTFISVRLSHPCPNRHRRHSKFPRQVCRLPASAYQLDYLVPKLLRIWWACLAHCSLLSDSAVATCGVVENGAPSPFPTATTGPTTTTAIKCPPYRGSSTGLCSLPLPLNAAAAAVIRDPVPCSRTYCDRVL